MKSLLVLLSLFTLSCSEDSETDQPIEHPWDTSFFAPRVGEMLTYQGTLEFISPQQTRPVPPQDIQKRMIKRVQIYDGPETIEGQLCHRYSVYNDDQFSEGIILHWNGKELSVVGTFVKGEEPKAAKTPIPLAHIHMMIGSYWHWSKGTSPGIGSRIVDFEPITVPAGTFDAYKVSVRKNTNEKIILSEYWFAPKVGVVKKQNRVYSGGLLRSNTIVELTARGNQNLPPNESS